MKLSGHESLIALQLTKGLGQGLIRRCLAHFTSADAVVGASATELSQIRGISLAGAGRIKRSLEEVLAGDAVSEELACVERHGARLISLGEDSYPKLLSLIPNPPVLLWVKGELLAEDAVSLGIVGARKCTRYGREQAERFGTQCAAAGLTIVSGGAYGIDAAAHRGALRAKGRTLVVLGSGLAKPYPKEHVELFRDVTQSGAVISELPMNTPPIAENFLPRNRIVSGLSLATLVIEAALRSGALSTARRCVDDHSREVLALPGPVDSKVSAGCHKMIREGWATLVTSPEDVLGALGEAGEMLRLGQGAVDQEAEAPVAPTGLTPTQQQLVAALDTPRSLDELVTVTGLDVAAVRADLTILEIRGTLTRNAGLFAVKR